jgi:hypothetical protein
MLRNPSLSVPRKNGNESKAAPHCYTRIRAASLAVPTNARTVATIMSSRGQAGGRHDHAAAEFFSSASASEPVLLRRSGYVPFSAGRYF